MKKSWKPKLIEELSPQITVTWPTQEQQAVNRDFGGFINGDASVIFKPKNSAEVQAIVGIAGQQQLQLTPRCFGLSQSGQSLAPSGVAILDLSELNAIGEIDKAKQCIPVGPAVTWADLITISSPHGLIPYVQPFNLDLSIAGVLAAGGIGASSPFYGACSAHVDGLQLVMGTGDKIHCDQAHHPELLLAATSNVNRHSIITEATIKLRPFKAKTRTFFLVYDDYHVWLDDQQQLAANQCCDYIESFCSASLQGMRNTEQGRRPFATWLYALQLSIEYDEGDDPDLVSLDIPLHYWRLLHIDDNNTLDYLHRHEPRFAMMRQTGLWEQHHPWYEIFLDEDAVENLLEELLEIVPLSLGGICHLFPVAKQHLPEFFMTPTAKQLYAFTILPGGVVGEQANTMLPALKAIHEKCLAQGGKRYLSGLLYDTNEQFWQQHYGAQYQQWKQLKQQYDPQHVFTSMLFEQ